MGFPATQCKTTMHIVASVNPWQDSGWLPVEPHSPSRQCYFPHHCAPQNPFPSHPWLPLPLTEGDSKLLREDEHLGLACCRNPQSNPRKPFAKAWKPLFTSDWFIFHTPSISFTVYFTFPHISADDLEPAFCWQDWGHSKPRVYKAQARHAWNCLWFIPILLSCGFRWHVVRLITTVNF